MAIYRLESYIITRSQGKSIVACSAYRSGEKLYDERYDKLHDYTGKEDVAHNEILLPEGAPEWMRDRQTLWNFVEATEKRKDSQLAREILLALPRELTLSQNIQLTREFVQNRFVSCGMLADVSIHVPEASDGGLQPHAHVLLTMREIKEGRFGLKVREWNAKTELDLWRGEWGEYANKHLALNGHDIRIDHRSLKDQGIDLEPQKKIGVASAFYHGHSIEEHQEIARRNGEKLLEKPEIVFDVLTRQQSTFTHQDIARIVNRYTVDTDQFQAVYEKVKASLELVYLGKDDKNRERFTTREMLKVEADMVAHAKGLEEKSEGHQVNGVEQGDIITKHTLSSEQQHVLEHLISAGDLKSVVGYAGAGKSRLLGAAKEIWEQGGYRVIGAALAGKAAENLEFSSGIDSRTIASRIHYWDRGQEQLSSKDILVIDEAGMLDSRQMLRLLQEANKYGAKVILVGDPEQLQAILAGPAFKAIVDRMPYVELVEIWRQKADWQKEATVQFATQQTQDAVAQYAIHGHVHEHETQVSAKEALIEAWNERRLVSPQDSQIMLAYTRSDVYDLNQMARSIRQSLGELGSDHLIVTDRGERAFAEGDRLYFLKNDRELGVKNGTLGTLVSLDQDQNTMAVRLDKEGITDAPVVSFSLNEYHYIDHGYAATIHKSQGATVDHTYVLASEYLDRHATYVAMTRHREGVELYWSREKFTDYDEMVKSLSRERTKEFSLDYPERDFAAYRGVASEGYPTFESYPVELGVKDDFVLDWKAMREDVDQRDPGFTQELHQHLFGSPELGLGEKDDLSDLLNYGVKEHGEKDEADWRELLFYGIDQKVQQEEQQKEDEKFKEILFAGMEIPPDDSNSEPHNDLMQDREIDF